MKKLLLLAICSLVIGCATSDYGTFGYNSPIFKDGNVTVSDNGLTKEQITSILNTDFPGQPPISISIIPIPSKSYNYKSKDLLPEMIKSLQEIEWINRIVPIPNDLIPVNLSFSVIQELGIRSLCKYSIIFIGDYYKYYTWKKIADGKYEIKSTVEFLLIDNQTTAIIAVDKLFTTMETEFNLFDSTYEEESRKKIFAEQSNILKSKLIDLFNY